MQKTVPIISDNTYRTLAKRKKTMHNVWPIIDWSLAIFLEELYEW